MTLLPTRSGTGVGRIVEAVGPVVESHADLVCGALRRWWPVVSTPWAAVVVRDDDVRQVLARREDFSVVRYRPKATEVVGPFPLALDAAHEYLPARQIIDVGYCAEDPDRRAARARELMETAVAQAAGGGEVDAVGTLVDPVLLRLVAEYLGVDGVALGSLAHWSRILFTEIFFLPTSKVRPGPMAVAAAMQSAIEGGVARRQASIARGEAQPDDVAGRLLGAGQPPAVVTATLLGLVVASFPNASKTAALLVDELLGRPVELAGAIEAARTDPDRFAAYVWEAARLRPQTPGILRRCERDCRVGLSTGRPRTIRRGATVLAMTQSAMVDEGAVEAPREFRLDRAWTDQLHFGYGMHSCYGARLSAAVLPALLQPLFARGLSRAPGRAGRLAWAYPYPSRLIVHL